MLRATPTIHISMADLIAARPAARKVLARRGMACVGCSMARFETLSEAAVAYDFDPQEFLREIDRADQIHSRRQHVPANAKSRRRSTRE